MNDDKIRDLSHQWISNLHGKEFNSTSEEMLFQSYAYQDGYKAAIKEMQESNEGKALLYAVEKTAERTKREMVEKAVKWLDDYFESVINSDLVPVASGQEGVIDKVRMARRLFANKQLFDFRKAMEDTKC